MPLWQRKEVQEVLRRLTASSSHRTITAFVDRRRRIGAAASAVAVPPDAPIAAKDTP